MNYSMRKLFLKTFLIIMYFNISVLFSSWLAAETEAEIEKLIGEFNKEDFIANAGSNEILSVSLEGCIECALKNNLEVKISKKYPDLFNEDIRIARAEFEPTFKTELNFADSSDPSNSLPVMLGGVVLSVPEERDTYRNGNLDFGVGGKIITGAAYELYFNNNRYKSNSGSFKYNPYYSSELGLTVTQPLLRGFGTYINRAYIVIAQNNYAVSSEEFKQSVINIVSGTKEIYFNCIFARDAYDIAKDYLKLAEELYEINKKRYEKGLVSSVALLELESAKAERLRYVIESQAAVKGAEDKLKLITNLVNDPELWNARFELIDSPDFSICEIDLVDSLKDAFEFRPDYLSAKTSLKNNDIRIKVAKNGMLPTLDLTGSFGLNGLGEDIEKAIKDVDYKHKDWYAGITLEIPWGGGERADYEKSKIEKAIALLGLKNLEHNIILDVRDKVRNVEVQRRQVEAARFYRDTEVKNYEAQKKRFNAGQVSTHDMLDYQDKLSEAKLQYLSALIDYQIALIRLARSEGLTLVKNGVRIEE